eukprot:4220226-Pyramimonas_sp.AAC.2
MNSYEDELPKQAGRCAHRRASGSAGIFPRRTNQTQEARVYSHDGPLRHRKRGCIIMTDQSDAGSAGIFSAHPKSVSSLTTAFGSATESHH